MAAGELSDQFSNPGSDSQKAYDLLVQCEAGLLSVTGTQDSPSKAGIGGRAALQRHWVYFSSSSMRRPRTRVSAR